jgi:hypothetical protein
MLCLVVPRAAAEDAREAAAKLTIRNFEKAAKAYFVRDGRFPEKLEDLIAGDRPFLEPKKDILLDPWGKKYQYDAAGKMNNGEKPDIWTETPDKKIIGNWPDSAK